MSSPVMRNLKSFIYTYSVYLLTFLGTQVALLLYCHLILSRFQSAAMNGYIISITVMFAFMAFFQLTSIYLGMSLSFCNTRRAAFLSSLILKVLLCAGLLLSTVVVQAALGLLFTSSVSGLMFPPPAYLLLYCGMIFSGVVGELMGYLCHALGRMGMVIFIIVCVVFGASVGVSFAIMGSLQETVLPAFLQGGGLLYGLSAAVLAAAALLCGVNYLFNRRFVVKS